jgi:hypothetical protein
MTDAVIVNPFSREEISEGLKRALSMERSERISRWQRLMDGVRRSDVEVWRDSFVAALEASHEPRLPLFQSPTKLLLREGIDDHGPDEAGGLPRQAEFRHHRRAQRARPRAEIGAAPLRRPEA